MQLLSAEALLADKRIVGRAMEKQAAREAADDAIAAGHGAFMVEQESRGMFRTSCGNLLPNQARTRAPAPIPGCTLFRHPPPYFSRAPCVGVLFPWLIPPVPPCLCMPLLTCLPARLRGASPQQWVQIKITYIAELEAREDLMRFVVPKSLGPEIEMASPLEDGVGDAALRRALVEGDIALSFAITDATAVTFPGEYALTRVGLSG